MRLTMRGAALKFAAVTAVAALTLAGCASQANTSSGRSSSAAQVSGAPVSGPQSSGSGSAAGESTASGATSGGPSSGTWSSGGSSSAAGPSESASPGGDTLPPDVLGPTFVATQVTGKYSIVPGSTISLTFEEKSVAARAGCNNMFGPYTVSGDVLTVSRLGSTMMACDPALMQQDTWLSEFLASGPTWTYDGGTLQLANGTDTMQLTEALSGAAAVPDVRWELVGLISRSGSTVSAVDPSLSPWIEFDGTSVTIDTSCNTGSGSAEIADTTITFGPIALTLRGCPAPSSAVETAMTSVLQGVTDYTVTDDPSGQLLVIMSEDGSQGLQFQADPSVGPSGGASSTPSAGAVSSGG